MAISVTDIGTAQVKLSTTLSITVPAGGVPAAALICLGIVTHLQTSFNSVIDTATNSYVQAAFKSDVGLTVQTNLYYVFNCKALVSGNSITVSTPGSNLTYDLSAFYATGILSTSDPLDTPATSENNTGSSATPSATLAAAPAVASSLIVAVLGTNGPSGDTFTQDSTNAAWAAPPTRIGTTGGGATSNVTLAGGNVVASTAVTYAPAITSRSWTEVMCAFKPVPPANVPYGWQNNSTLNNPYPHIYRALGGSPT